MRLRHRRALLGLAVATYGVYKISTLSSDPYAAHQKMPTLAPYYEEPPSRNEQLRKLTEEKSTYDVIVVGGGITGAGVTLDAATRGLRVCLLEADDFMAETSSRSTKLIHGGIRYLELAFKQLDWRQLALVYEALRERENLMSIGPHLSRSLPIMIPVYSWFDLIQMYVGVKMYDLLAGSKTIDRSSFMTARRAVTKYPLLRTDGLKGAIVYHDGQHDDSRMGLSVVITAAQHGATVANYTKVTGLIHDANAGKVRGVKAVDQLTGKTFTVNGNVVVNATGIFADSVLDMDKATTASASSPDFTLSRVNAMTAKRADALKDSIVASSFGAPRGDAGDAAAAAAAAHIPERSDLKAIRLAAEAARERVRRPVIAASSGAHVTLPLLFCPGADMGVLVRTSDNRVLFLLPWEGVAVAGTTDVPCDVRRSPVPTPTDVPFILRELTSFLHPSIRARMSDVLSAWAGIRPLVRIDAFDQQGGRVPGATPAPAAAGAPAATGVPTSASGGDPAATPAPDTPVKDDAGTAKLARSHFVHTSASGLVTIVGGKWTTYRAMAEETVDAAIRAASPPLTHAAPCRTRMLPLYGSAGWSPRDALAFMHEYGIDGSTAKHVSRTYGDRARKVLDAAAAEETPFRRLVSSPVSDTMAPATAAAHMPAGGDPHMHPPGQAAAYKARIAKLPYLAVEVDRAVDVEFAQTVIDVVSRRTRLAFLDAKSAAEAVPAIADRMQAKLGWSAARKKEEVRQFVCVYVCVCVCVYPWTHECTCVTSSLS